MDEHLDLVEEAQVTARDARAVDAELPAPVRAQHPEAVAAIRFVADTLDEIVMEHERRKESAAANGEAYTVTARIVSDKDIPYVNFLPLRKAIKSMQFYKVAGRKRRPKEDEQERIREDFNDILKAIEITLENWRWYSKTITQHTLNSARLIVPDDGQTGAVVLDATAGRNLVYKLFKDRADVIPSPAVARRYDNATLHVSRGHRVGKVSMEDEKVTADHHIEFVEKVRETFGPDRKVLLLTHKGVAESLKDFRPDFDMFDIAWWGSVAGRNDWREFDLLLVYGIPTLPDAYAVNTFMAFQGVQTDEWLNAEDRPYDDHQDILKDLRIGRTIVDIIQGMMRISMRRVVDADGNCPRADVVMLLPEVTGGRILEAVVEESPGIRVEEISIPIRKAKGRGRAATAQDKLIDYLLSLPQGRHGALEVRKACGTGTKAWRSVIKQIKTQTGQKAGRLSCMVYTSNGRGAKAWFEKKDPFPQ